MPVIQISHPELLWVAALAQERPQQPPLILSAQVKKLIVANMETKAADTIAATNSVAALYKVTPIVRIPAVDGTFGELLFDMKTDATDIYRTHSMVVLQLLLADHAKATHLLLPELISLRSLG